MIGITGTTVTLMVDDLDKSQTFYIDLLGFAVEYRAGPHFAMIQRDGLRLGLHPRGTNPNAGECRGISLGFQVSDIRAGALALEQAGVAFPDGVQEDGPLLRADFTDPDGTALYLVQL